MVMSMQTTLLATALLVAGVTCQDTARQPVFTYPPYGSNYTYHRMDTVIVNYTVPYDTAELSIFCDPSRGNLVNHQTVPGFTDSVPILLNFVSDEPCWFDLRAAGPDGINSNNNRSSASFSILRNERGKPGPQTFGVDTDPPTTTTTTPSPTPSATASTAPPADKTDASTETSTPPPEDGGAGGGGGGLKGGALYAVSFCSGIGLAILLGLGFRLWWKYECWQTERKRRVALAAAQEKYRHVRNGNGDSGSGSSNGNGSEGNGGSGGRGNGGEEDAAPRLDVDVFMWRRREGAGGTTANWKGAEGAKGGAGVGAGASARGESRDEPDGDGVARAV